MGEVVRLMAYIGRQPFIPVPYTVQSTVLFLFYGQPFSLNFYYNTIDANWTPAMQLYLASTLGTYTINRYMPLMAQDVSLWKVICKDLSVESGYSITVPYSGYNGGIASEGHPVSVCYRMNTYPGRRVGIPNFYYPISGLAELGTVDNTILPEYADLWKSALIESQDMPIPFECYEVRISYREGNVWRSEGQLWYNVNAYVDHLELGQRRKRLKNQLR